MATKKTTSFEVSAIVKMWVTIGITAGSMAEAVELSKTLKITDFVETPGEMIDHSHKIIGVADPVWDMNI